MGTRPATLGAERPVVAGVCGLLCSLLAVPAAGVGADLRIGNLSVFLNDCDVTVQVVLLGAVPASLHESLHSGHRRPTCASTSSCGRTTGSCPDRAGPARTIERQVTYNVLTKEYKVASAGR